LGRIFAQAKLPRGLSPELNETAMSVRRADLLMPHFSYFLPRNSDFGRSGRLRAERVHSLWDNPKSGSWCDPQQSGAFHSLRDFY